MARMQITITCLSCNQPKRPLLPCPACDASGLPEGELRAWRRALHAHGLARITATPRPYPLPVLAAREAVPQQLIVVLEGEPAVAGRREAAIIPLEPPVAVDDAKSFDWEDEGPLGWLRRSA
jgi:hypothetical protein